jgi:hypothetical protein
MDGNVVRVGDANPGTVGHANRERPKRSLSNHIGQQLCVHRLDFGFGGRV